MEKFNRLIIALILMAFMACQKDNSGSSTPNTTPLSDTLRIKVGETVTTPDFSIKLDSITGDSRCPTNANCIWAGSADAKLVVQKNNSSQIVKLTTVAITPNLRDTATVFGHFIKFISASPYPTGTSAIRQNEYVISLLVK